METREEGKDRRKGGKRRQRGEGRKRHLILCCQVPESSFMSIVLQGSCAQEFYKFGSSCSYFWNFAKKEENRLSISNRFKEVDVCLPLLLPSPFSPLSPPLLLLSSTTTDFQQKVVHMLNEEYPDKIHADEYKKDRSLRTWRHVNSRYPVLNKVYGSKLGIFMCELPDGEPVMVIYHTHYLS